MIKEEKLRRYLKKLLKSEIPDERIGSHWIISPYGTSFEYEQSVTRCTTSAMMIAHDFGGHVYGYEIKDEDPEEIIGYDCGGHDFAIVEHYLVDYWSEHVNGSGPSILDLTNPEHIQIVMKKYLPLDRWESLDEWATAK